jgi:hypothetical protein
MQIQISFGSVEVQIRIVSREISANKNVSF